MPHKDIDYLRDNITDNISHLSKVAASGIDAISKLTKKTNTIRGKFG